MKLVPPWSPVTLVGRALVVVAICLLEVWSSPVALAQNYNVLVYFARGSAGPSPTSGLAVDQRGNL